MVDGKITPYKGKVEKLFKKAGEILEQDFSHVSVSVNFVSGQEISQLNSKYRNKKNETDVLSFPNLNITAGQKLIDFAGEVVDGELFLGDIVICREVALRQAAEFGHSEEREVCFLALHGLLHLLGYDHINKADEEVMCATSEKILSSFGVLR